MRIKLAIPLINLGLILSFDSSTVFEAGYAVHEVSMFTLHKDWKTLKRYTQLKAGEVRDLD